MIRYVRAYEGFTPGVCEVRTIYVPFYTKMVRIYLRFAARCSVHWWCLPQNIYKSKAALALCFVVLPDYSSSLCFPASGMIAWTGAIEEREERIEDKKSRKESQSVFQFVATTRKARLHAHAFDLSRIFPTIDRSSFMIVSSLHTFCLSWDCAPLPSSHVVFVFTVQVIESGTEAAAATAAVFKRRESAIRYETDLTLTADHPFLCFIHDTEGNILFVSQVCDSSWLFVSFANILSFRRFGIPFQRSLPCLCVFLLALLTGSYFQIFFLHVSFSVFVRLYPLFSSSLLYLLAWLLACLIDWLIAWLFNWLINWLTGHQSYCHQWCLTFLTISSWMSGWVDEWMSKASNLIKKQNDEQRNSVWFSLLEPCSLLLLNWER